VENGSPPTPFGIKADFGAAIYADGTCTAILTGRSTFRANTATNGGGALLVAGTNATITFKGAICAQGNSAPFGNFAYLGRTNLPGGVLILDGPSGSALTNGGTGGGDIYMRPGTQLRCGSGSPSWTDATQYQLTGDMCACNAEFVAGNSTTCNRCGALGWVPARCACAVSVLEP